MGSSMSTLKSWTFSVNQKRDFPVDLLNFDLNNSTQKDKKGNREMGTKETFE